MAVAPRPSTPPPGPPPADTGTLADDGVVPEPPIPTDTPPDTPDPEPQPAQQT